MSRTDHLARLLSVRSKKCRTVLGMVSGTSMDGVDVACVQVRGTGPGLRVDLRAAETIEYPTSLRAALLGARRLSASNLARLDMMVGAFFAEAARRFLRSSELPLAAIDLVGSHGQTVCHAPPSAGIGDLLRGELWERWGVETPATNASGREERPSLGATLQLGDGDVIAERLGIPTVSDFRRRDLAAGGEGAPLVPYLDHLLFAGPGGPRVVLNLGGIANVTYLGDDVGQTLGFDTGPANMLLDGLIARSTGGRQRFDRDGGLARRGRVNRKLLAWLLDHPFFTLAPPRSAGRAEFGDQLVTRILAAWGDLPLEDLATTATELTVRSVAKALLGPERLIPHSPAEVLACGGGVHNPVLMERLARELAPIPLSTTESRGVSVDAKEAILFAVLASETIGGRAGNLPAVTGAKAAVPLGKISL